MKLAVYGTLRRFHPNNAKLGKATFIGETRLPNLSLFDLGWFPGVAFDRWREENPGVVVEIYDVPDEQIPTLDRYEGYDEKYPQASLFRRVTVDVPGLDEVSLYVFNQDVGGKRLILSGDWKERNVINAG